MFPELGDYEDFEMVEVRPGRRLCIRLANNTSKRNGVADDGSKRVDGSDRNANETKERSISKAGKERQGPTWDVNSSGEVNEFSNYKIHPKNAVPVRRRNNEFTDQSPVSETSSQVELQDRRQLVSNSDSSGTAISGPNKITGTSNTTLATSEVVMFSNLISRTTARPNKLRPHTAIPVIRNKYSLFSPIQKCKISKCSGECRKGERQYDRTCSNRAIHSLSNSVVQSSTESSEPICMRVVLRDENLSVMSGVAPEETAQRVAMEDLSLTDEELSHLYLQTSSASNFTRNSENNRWRHSAEVFQSNTSLDEGDCVYSTGTDTGTCTSCASSVSANQERESSSFVVKGDEDISNMAVFFIHGVGSSADVWKVQMQYFSQLGCLVVAPDLVGHGFSCSPDNTAAYEFNQVALDVLAVFDRYHKSDNVVVGHSYG